MVILGAGQAGGNAARMAAALGAQVTVFERKRERMQQMRALGDNVTALYPFDAGIAEALLTADLLIGAILVPGAKTPKLVSRRQVATMEPGSVIVDISVDQGGCIETTHATTYESPTYVDQGVVHFGVTNMPGAVPRSASQALSAAMIPYLRELLSPEWRSSPVLSAAINVEDGRLLHPALREIYR